MDRTQLTKIARIVGELDQIAEEIQPQDERIALHLDRVSDMMEKVAYTPQGWIPGRGMGGVWQPGNRIKMNQPGSKPDPGAMMVCNGCGWKYRMPLASRSSGFLPSTCPHCGHSMSRIY